MTPTRKHARGLTIVELLVATTLASMMIVATMGLLKTMALQQSALKARTDFEPWKRSLVEQLRRDMANARLFELKNASDNPNASRSKTSTGPSEAFDRFVLTGYCAISPSTFRATHRPARISYGVETLGERSWLVRYEESLESRSNTSTHKEFLCSGVTGIAMELPDDKREDRTNSTPQGFAMEERRWGVKSYRGEATTFSNRNRSRAPRFGTLPDSCRIVLLGQNRSTVLMKINVFR